MSRFSVVAFLTLVSLLIVSIDTRPAAAHQSEAPPCGPIDAAWAAAIRVVDAETRRPVANVGLWAGTIMDVAETDSSGWACFRSLVSRVESVTVGRPGYHEVRIALRGTPGSVVKHEVAFERVRRPCCNMEGRWFIEFQLDSPALYHPKPAGRTASGDLKFGGDVAPPEGDDELDSLVRTVRGLHQVNFTPFFGGPVARDVSTTVFGSGPNLYREVMAVVHEGDRVEVTFIPRMSHGSISLDGRIRSDTVRGTWVQNAFCCGAYGVFTMHRIGPAPTARTPRRSTPPPPPPRWRTGAAGPPASVEAGSVPRSNWRPELAVDSTGRLWLASGGLFVADAFGGRWSRVLGGPTDPLDKDELRVGVKMAFFGTGGAVLGMPMRFHSAEAPVVYRTDNAGASWTSIVLTDLREVDALEAVGNSFWLVGTRRGSQASAFFRSEDAGATWRRHELPSQIRNVTLLHRVSLTMAYLGVSVRDGGAAFWRTTDGGRTWTAIPSPHDQDLHRVMPSGTRIEQVATVGRWLVVREHGRVFATPVDTIRWLSLPRAKYIASDAKGAHLFVLDDSLFVELLDDRLQKVWRSTQTLPRQSPSGIEQVIWRGDVGYVSMTGGALYEVRHGRVRTLGRPAPQAETRAEVRIDPPAT